MDIFIEQLVKRKKTARDFIVVLLLILSFFVIIGLAFFLSALINFYFMIVGFFLLMADVYAAWYFITGLNVEFEYSVTKNTLTIDKVIAKRKRKRVIEIKIGDIEEMCQIKKREINRKKCDKILFTGESEFGDDLYQMYLNTEKYGYTLIMFSPNEKVLNGMKPHLKHSIILDVFR